MIINNTVQYNIALIIRLFSYLHIYCISHAPFTHQITQMAVVLSYHWLPLFAI